MVTPPKFIFQVQHIEGPKEKACCRSIQCHLLICAIPFQTITSFSGALLVLSSVDSAVFPPPLSIFHSPAPSSASTFSPSLERNASLSARDGPCAVSPAVVKYTEDRIRRATVTMLPYPHVYIRDVFQPTFYFRCMMAHIPPVEATKQLYRRSSHTAASRWQVKLSGAGSRDAFSALAGARDAPGDVEMHSSKPAPIKTAATEGFDSEVQKQ